jgi:4-hydroxy-3-methylbut-2-enyl diphosphate reductase
VREGLDLMLVVGGYNSSNTGHLCEIASESCPSYHIDDATAIESADTLCHKPPHSRETVRTKDWLPEGEVTVGITAGASTPNRAIGETILRVLEVRGLPLPDEIREYQN